MFTNPITVINEPSNEGLVVKRWALTALDTLLPKNTKALSRKCAELLEILLHHFSDPTLNKKLMEMDAERIRKSVHVDNWGEWQPYDSAYLDELFLGLYTRPTITAIVKGLKEIGWIEVQTPHTNTDLLPDDIKENFSLLMTWIRLKPQAIEDFLRSNEFAPMLPGLEGMNPLDEKMRERKLNIQKKRDEIADQVIEYYMHVHRRDEQKYKPTGKRRQLLLQRIKDESRTLAELAQAVIGNAVSDFHQGRMGEIEIGESGYYAYRLRNNDDRKNPKFFNGMELIFRDEIRTDRFRDYAEELGIEAGDALADIEAVLNGATSRYILPLRVKSRGRTPDEKALGIDPLEMVKQREKRLQDLDTAKYRTFADLIAPFVWVGLGASDMMERATTDENLLLAGQPVSNREALNEWITKRVETAYGELSERKLQNIQEFCQQFIAWKIAQAESRQIKTEVNGNGNT